MTVAIQVIRMYRLDVPEDVIAPFSDHDDQVNAAESWAYGLTSTQIEADGDLCYVETDYAEAEHD